MLRNIVQLSLRPIYSTEFLRATGFTTATRCRYGRWAHRTPVAIENEDEVFGTETVDEANTVAKEARRKASRLYKEKLRMKEKKAQEKKTEEEDADKKQAKPIFKALKEDDKLIR